MGSTGSNKAALLGGTALALLAFGQAAMAQQAQPVKPQVNEEEKQDRVILLERLVLGAGAEKVAIDTPQAVTVVDQEDIDREQPETIGDIFDGVPGMAKIGSDRVLGESFNIRGIGTAEATGDESKIIVNIDGVKKFYEQYRMGSFFSDPELYKQVEVLRGPASSTLYGSGALGGVINFQTKDASDFIAEGMRGAVRMKSSYYSNGDGYLVSPLIAHRFNENVEVLATGNYRSSDIMEQADGRDLVGSEFDALSGLLKGTVRFGENNEQVLRASYQQWNSEGDDQRYNQTGSAGVGQTDFGTIDRDVKDRTAILAYENPFSDSDMLDLKIQASYSDTSVLQTDSSSKALCSPGQFIIFCDASYGYETWQLNAENTSTWNGDNWQNFLTYGFQASTQTREGHRIDNGAPISTHPEGDDTRLGLFAQNEFVWNEKLTIIPGIRGEFIWQEGSDDIKGARDIEDFAASPKIAALYKFNETFGVFGSIAHTERFPTLDELYTYSDPAAPRPPRPPRPGDPGNVGKTTSLELEKETSNNFEAGFTLSGNDLVVDGDGAALKTTAFYNKISNLIVSNANVPRPTNPRDPLPPAPSYFGNVDKATIYGIEIEGSYETDRFFGRLGYTALKGTNDTEKEDLKSIPGHKLSLTLGGRHPDYWLEYGAKINFVSSTSTGVVSADTQNADPARLSQGSKSYQTVDLFASWKPKEGKFAGLEATFGVDNLFDEDYRDNQTPDRSTGRSFKFTLAKQFDYQ